MTDVAPKSPKTPNKRKSFAGKNDNSAKKVKIENGSTKKFNKNNSNKIASKSDKISPKSVNIAPKSDKIASKNIKNSPKSVNIAPKANKMTPFKGVPKQEAKLPIKDEQKPKKQHKKHDLFKNIKEKLNSGKPEDKKEVITILEAKIKAIESKSELTKTANRKLKLMRKFKRVAEGVPPAEKMAPLAKTNQKSVSTKRRERRNKAKQDKESGVKNVMKSKQKKVVEEEEDDDDDDEEEEEIVVKKQQKVVAKENKQQKVVVKEEVDDDEDDEEEEEDDDDDDNSDEEGEEEEEESDDDDNGEEEEESDEDSD